MANRTFSSLTPVAFKGTIQIPGVDPSLPIDQQNVKMLASSWPVGTGGGGGATTIDDLTDAADLTGAPNSFVGFDKSGQPAVIISPVATTFIGFDGVSTPTAFNRLAALALLGLQNATMPVRITGAVVNNTTLYFTASSPEAFVINSMDWQVGTGTFSVLVAINGTPVTGLGAVAVSGGSAVVRANATAANIVAKGAVITAAISSLTGAPTNALLSLNLTRN